MTLVYHGTSLENGILIARAEALLSPWEKQLVDLEEFYKTHLDRKFEKDHPGKTKEEVALIDAEIGYNKREVEHRVKSISLSSTFSLANGYAVQYEKFTGGIVLALDSDKVPGFDKNNSHVLFVPRKCSIEGLKEIHVSPAALSFLNQLKREYSKYNPEYFLLNLYRESTRL